MASPALVAVPRLVILKLFILSYEASPDRLDIVLLCMFILDPFCRVIAGTESTLTCT